jgi:CMP-N-acetylneuraminic acid synthetase
MFKNKRILAIIPARSGSKRIKNKNIVKLKNKPLIGYTIKIAKKCKFIDKIVVSSESKKILKISEKLGVKTPFLREKAYDDHSSVDQATLAAVNQSEKYYGKFDIVVQLMPNCPIRSLETLNSSIRNFFKKKKNTQISFFEYSYVNPWWAHFIKKKNIIPLNRKLFFEKKRSQDLVKLYCPTGSIWISNINTLKKYKTFYIPSHGYFIMDFIESIDIDTHADLKIAENFINYFAKKNKISK